MQSARKNVRQGLLQRQLGREHRLSELHLDGRHDLDRDLLSERILVPLRALREHHERPLQFGRGRSLVLE